MCDRELGNKEMNYPSRVLEEEDDQGEVFLDDSDIIHEVTVDGEGCFLSLQPP